MRARLTEEERLARKRERARRSFSDAAYQHYDASAGFGSSDEWVHSAETMAGRYVPSPKPVRDSMLAILGLSSLPSSYDELRTAFAAAIRLAHPDQGGTEAGARACIEAFASLRGRFSK